MTISQKVTKTFGPVMQMMGIPINERNIICFSCLTAFLPYIMQQIPKDGRDMFFEMLKKSPAIKEEDLVELVCFLRDDFFKDEKNA